MIFGEKVQPCKLNASSWCLILAFKHFCGSKDWAGCEVHLFYLLAVPGLTDELVADYHNVALLSDCCHCALAQHGFLYNMPLLCCNDYLCSFQYFWRMQMITPGLSVSPLIDVEVDFNLPAVSSPTQPLLFFGLLESVF